MHGENGTAIDLGDVARVIDAAEVVVIGFPFCAERLLLDLRPDGLTGPLIQLVEPVDSASERTAWLNGRRPGLGAPEQIIFFLWPHSLDFLRESDALARVCERVRRDQGIDVAGDLQSALAGVRAHEAAHAAAAITGAEGFETLWPANR
jgi:hypothetical protein